MSSSNATRPHGLTRRDFLGLASAAAGLWLQRSWADPPADRGAASGADPHSLCEAEDLPVLHVPAVTRNGAKVPIVVEMAHPMTPDHHVTTVRVMNETDPVPSKGVFHFSPANGRVYLAFQARMNEGVSDVSLTAECSRHGRWSCSRRVEIPEGAGGCAGTAPPVGRTSGADIRPPLIRIPELVERGRIRRDEVFHVQVKMRHPNRTGLRAQEGGFVQASEPLHLKEMAVTYCGERVSRFEMTPALSDDPFITFTLVARREGRLRVLLVNNRGRRFEATHAIRLS